MDAGRIFDLLISRCIYLAQDYDTAKKLNNIERMDKIDACGKNVDKELEKLSNALTIDINTMCSILPQHKNRHWQVCSVFENNTNNYFICFVCLADNDKKSIYRNGVLRLSSKTYNSLLSKIEKTKFGIIFNTSRPEKVLTEQEVLYALNRLNFYKYLVLPNTSDFPAEEHFLDFIEKPMHNYSRTIEIDDDFNTEVDTYD